MKNILLIATGGTIACSSSDEGLTPSANVNELLSYIPHIKEKCKLSGISIMNIDSTNMNPELMMNIAKAIKEYRDNYDGEVCTGREFCTISWNYCICRGTRNGYNGLYCCGTCIYAEEL